MGFQGHRRDSACLPPSIGKAVYRTALGLRVFASRLKWCVQAEQVFRSAYIV